MAGGDRQDPGSDREREDEYRRWRIVLALVFGFAAAAVVVWDDIAGRDAQLPLVIVLGTLSAAMLAVELPRLMR